MAGGHGEGFEDDGYSATGAFVAGSPIWRWTRRGTSFIATQRDLWKSTAPASPAAVGEDAICVEPDGAGCLCVTTFAGTGEFAARTGTGGPSTNATLTPLRRSPWARTGRLHPRRRRQGRESHLPDDQSHLDGGRSLPGDNSIVYPTLVSDAPLWADEHREHGPRRRPRTGVDDRVEDSVAGNGVRDNASGGISNMNHIAELIFVGNVAEGNGRTDATGIATGVEVGPPSRNDPMLTSVDGNRDDGSRHDGIQFRRHASGYTVRGKSYTGNDLRNGLDLRDFNADCATNVWIGNWWGSARFAPEGTTVGGRPASVTLSAKVAAESPAAGVGSDV